MQNSDKTDESFYQTVQIWSGIFIELSGVYDLNLTSLKSIIQIQLPLGCFRIAQIKQK